MTQQTKQSYRKFLRFLKDKQYFDNYQHNLFETWDKNLQNHSIFYVSYPNDFSYNYLVMSFFWGTNDKDFNYWYDIHKKWQHQN